MKTKSVNHLSVTARLTDNATAFGENTVARFTAVHHIGSSPLFLNCVMYANKGKKFERVIPMDKLTKGNNLLLDGYLRQVAWTNEAGEKKTKIEFVVNKINEPEVIADDAPEADDEEVPAEDQPTEA